MLTLKRIKNLECKKNYHTLKKGIRYSVSGGYGDPEKAIELGFEYDMPLGLMSLIIIADENDVAYFFKPFYIGRYAYNQSITINNTTKQSKQRKYPLLWDYFYKPNELRALKLKKIKKSA